MAQNRIQKDRSMMGWGPMKTIGMISFHREFKNLARWPNNYATTHTQQKKFKLTTLMT